MEDPETDKKKFYCILKAAIQGEEHLTGELKALINTVAKTCRKEKKKKNGQYKLTPYEKIKCLT